MRFTYIIPALANIRKPYAFSNIEHAPSLGNGLISDWQVDSPMGIVRLGKMHLRWCMECNLPILESESCPVCGKATRQVEMTPPGEARPGFPHDLDFVRRLLDAQF